MQEKRPSLPQNKSVSIPSEILAKMNEFSSALQTIHQSPLPVLILIRELRALISNCCGEKADINAIYILLENIFESYPETKIKVEKLIPLYQLSRAMNEKMSNLSHDKMIAEDYGSTYTILVAILTVSRSLKRNATSGQMVLDESYRELARSLPQHIIESRETSFERNLEFAHWFYLFIESEHKPRILEIEEITEGLNKSLDALLHALQEKDEDKICELSHKLWVTNQRQDILQTLREAKPLFFYDLMRAYKAFFGRRKPDAPFLNSTLFKLEYFRYEVMIFLKAHEFEDYTIENARFAGSIHEVLQRIIEKHPQCIYEISCIKAAYEETSDVRNQLIFTDLTGTLIANPKNLIAEINEPFVSAIAEMDELNALMEKRPWTKEEEHSFNVAHERTSIQPRKIDYRARNQLSQVALTQRWGRRETQEDHFSFSYLPKKFKDLDETDIHNSLTYIPHFLQTRIEQCRFQEYCNTTFLSTLIYGNNIYTVSIGNSIALFCIVTMQGKVILEQINTPTYSPREITPHTEGYSGIIATSQEAEYYETQIDSKEDTKVFVINASDGLMNEKWQMSLTEIQKLIQEAFQANPDTTSEQLSSLLADEAFKRGSEDNITVLVAPVPQSPLRIDSVPTFPFKIDIFDGQRGDNVAYAVSELYTPALVMQILLSKLSQLNSSLSQGIRLSISAFLANKNIEEAKCLMDEFNSYIINSVLRLCTLEQNIQTIIQIVKEYYLAIQANQTAIIHIEGYLKRYCENFDFHFLSHPLFVSKYQMRNIRLHYEEALKNGISVQDEELKADGIEAEMRNLEKLYQVASIVLRIRLNCAAKKYNDKENKITIIENKLKTLFEQYPHLSPEEIIKHLYTNLGVLMQKQSGIYHNRLDTEIKKARKEIEEMRNIMDLSDISLKIRRAYTS